MWVKSLCAAFRRGLLPSTQLGAGSKAYLKFRLFFGAILKTGERYCNVWCTRRDIGA